MIKIDYPPYQPKIQVREDKEFIFDEVRKRWILLTPEEWVRQNFLQFLIKVKGYPAALLAVEKEIRNGEMVNRFDIVVYDQTMCPWLIVECKEMNELLNEKVLLQALRYNVNLQVSYIIITNGAYCYGFECRNGQFSEIDALPAFEAG